MSVIGLITPKVFVVWCEVTRPSDLQEALALAQYRQQHKRTARLLCLCLQGGFFGQEAWDDSPLVRYTLRQSNMPHYNPERGELTVSVTHWSLDDSVRSSRRELVVTRDDIRLV